jgi:hypothetical protein
MPSEALFSSISASERRWRAFVLLDGQTPVNGHKLRSTDSHITRKTRLQRIIFSRIHYLYKTPQNGP